MAKKIEVKEPSVTIDPQTPTSAVPAELTHSSLSMVRNGTIYSVIRIRFNPDTKDVGEIETVAHNLAKLEAEGVLKVAVAKEIFAKQMGI